jgi:hypothetical protein
MPLSAAGIWIAALYYAWLAGADENARNVCVGILVADIVRRWIYAWANRRMLAKEIAQYVLQYGPLPSGSAVGEFVMNQVSGSVQDAAASWLGNTPGAVAGAIFSEVLGSALDKASMTPDQAAFYDAIRKRNMITRPHYQMTMLLGVYMGMIAFVGGIAH